MKTRNRCIKRFLMPRSSDPVNDMTKAIRSSDGGAGQTRSVVSSIVTGASDVEAQLARSRALQAATDHAIEYHVSVLFKTALA